MIVFCARKMNDCFGNELLLLDSIKRTNIRVSYGVVIFCLTGIKLVLGTKTVYYQVSFEFFYLIPPFISGLHTAWLRAFWFQFIHVLLNGNVRENATSSSDRPIPDPLSYMRWFTRQVYLRLQRDLEKVAYSQVFPSIIK